jgi:hypothetical protein
MQGKMKKSAGREGQIAWARTTSIKSPSKMQGQMKNPIQKERETCMEMESKPVAYTIGDAIEVAKKKKGLAQPEGSNNSKNANKSILGCFMIQCRADSGPSLCTNIHDEHEKIEVMVDSGPSETVASQDKFPSYPMMETTASGTTYSSAVEKQAEDIVNLGQKYAQVVDEMGNET